MIWKWKLPAHRHTRIIAVLVICVNQFFGGGIPICIPGISNVSNYESCKPRLKPRKHCARWRVRIFICMSSVRKIMPSFPPRKITPLQKALITAVDFPLIRSPCHVSFDTFTRWKNKEKCWFCLASIRWIEGFLHTSRAASGSLNRSKDRPLRHYNCHWISCQPEALFGWLTGLTGLHNLMWHWCVSPLNEQIWQDISRGLCLRLPFGYFFRFLFEGCSLLLGGMMRWNHITLMPTTMMMSCIVWSLDFLRICHWFWCWFGFSDSLLLWPTLTATQISLDIDSLKAKVNWSSRNANNKISPVLEP